MNLNIAAGEIDAGGIAITELNRKHVIAIVVTVAAVRHTPTNKLRSPIEAISR
jgi:hypothetical protein